MSISSTRYLQDWSFTQIGGGEGTKDGEWLQVSEFPTTVHVELLKLKKIPDPVRLIYSECYRQITDPHRYQFIGLQEWDVQCQSEASGDRPHF
jgi:beta-mannosidase